MSHSAPLRPLARGLPWAVASVPPSLAPPAGLPSGTDAVALPGVGYAEVVQDLVVPGGRRARQSLDGWLARRFRGSQYQEVHDWVVGCRHAVLHRLSVAEVERATTWPTRRGTVDPRHALGDLDKRVDRITEVEDWRTPPWAFGYLFHDLMEQMGAVPQWPDVEAFLRGPARSRLLLPFAADFGFPGRTQEARVQLCRALRWRLANAYYSFVREVDLLTRLRQQHDLDVRYHVLADAQFKVDLWCGPALVALLVVNPKYRQAGDGRKRRAEHMLEGASFRKLSVELAVPDAFGRPSLVPAAEIARLALTLKDALSDNRSSALTPDAA